jgi:mannose-1-phosphate guanylyltransferase
MKGIILAGGDGTRLRPLTRRIAGDERPKQFCRLLDRETLLEQTVRRAGRLIPPEQTVAVVVRAHERYYAPLLSGVPAPGLVVQPENRGTAPAILYGLLSLDALVPTGAVAIFPSDHYVSDDDLFMAHVAAAFHAARLRPDLAILLGSVPRTPEPEYGWIEPAYAMPIEPRGRLSRVRQFWEKPPPALARKLLGLGCLWNTFVIVASVRTLLALVKEALPDLYERFAAIRPAMGTSSEQEAVRALYAQIPSIDFSRHVLATCPANLAVLALNGVEWDDLGEPRRVMARLARIGMRPEWIRPEAAVIA